MPDTTIKRIASPIMTTGRLVLRPFVMDDAQALFTWACDLEVTRYLRFPSHEDIGDSRKVIERWISEATKPPFFHWAITIRTTKEVVGSIGIDVQSPHDNRGEVGYCLARHVWNRGYATEALQAVLDFGLQIAGFHRIEACHSVSNPASGKVMRKAGMRFEAGPLHHYYRSDALGYQDTVMYAAFSDIF